jgi:hypothetical protein
VASVDVAGPIPAHGFRRTRATTYLREALAEGRLDQSEFDERVEAALRAKTQADLDPLFRDLPGPPPGQGLAPVAGFTAPPWQGAASDAPGADIAQPAPAGEVATHSNRAFEIVAAVAWPLTIMACFAVGWQYWWLMFIPIAISAIAGTRHQGRDRNRER